MIINSTFGLKYCSNSRWRLRNL